MHIYIYTYLCILGSPPMEVVQVDRQPYQKWYVWWVPRGPGDVSSQRAQFANGKITSFNS